MIQYNVFKDGKKRIVTFSYDDGPVEDIRLVSLFNKYNLKGTFHLNGWRYKNVDDKTITEKRELYNGHEIACHTVNHGWPSLIPPTSLTGETFFDRIYLEKLAGYPVVGMSYPSGDYSDEAVTVMQSCGIVYARTTVKGDNKMPTDFMRWHPTCHHSNMEEQIDSFLKVIDSQWYGPLLYIWGHSHELKTEQQWADFENSLAKIANNDKIWYATNIEIYNYVKAQKSLVISADESIIYNPSAIDVWVEKDKTQIIKIPAGQTYIK